MGGAIDLDALELRSFFNSISTQENMVCLQSQGFQHGYVPYLCLTHVKKRSHDLGNAIMVQGNQCYLPEVQD